MYADAVALLEVAHRAQADLGRFTPAQQVVLTDFRDDLAAMVDAGPDQFGSDDVSTLLAGAARTVSLLTSGTCDGFLPRGG